MLEARTTLRKVKGVGFGLLLVLAVGLAAEWAGSAFNGFRSWVIPAIVLGVLSTPIIINPAGRTKRMTSSLRRPLAFAAIPLFLLPFALAVIFESKTNILPNGIANFLYGYGRNVLPLSYVYEVHSYGIQAIVQPTTHIWDVAFWAICSIIFGFLTQRLRLRYSFLIAPFVILVIVVVFHYTMLHLGYIFWDLPFRVVS